VLVVVVSGWERVRVCKLKAASGRLRVVAKQVLLITVGHDAILDERLVRD